MFNPTHLLVSRSKQTPVQLVRSSRGFALVTETEWRRHCQPTFELHPKRGIFCKGVQVVGYSLQPLKIQESSTVSAPVAIGAGE